jgi:hypothetical protein
MHRLDAVGHFFLYDWELETTDHIIASWSFSRKVWWNILATLSVNITQHVGEKTVLITWWSSLRAHWNDHRRCESEADSLFALVAWELWKEQNGRCFHDTSTTVQQILASTSHIADQWIGDEASKLGSLLRE